MSSRGNAEALKLVRAIGALLEFPPVGFEATLNSFIRQVVSQLVYLN